MILPEVWLYGQMEEFSMPRKRHKLEEIVISLRQVEVLTARGRTVAEVTASPHWGLKRRACPRCSLPRAAIDFECL